MGTPGRVRASRALAVDIAPPRSAGAMPPMGLAALDLAPIDTSTEHL
jgi:hypothetical protein